MSSATVRPSSRRRIKVLALVAGTAAVLGAAACGSGSERGDDGTVLVRLPGDYDSLDPAKSGVVTGRMMALASYDYLMAANEEGELVPWIARSWKVNPTSVTFTVRTDATCGDGTRVTPELIARSIQRHVETAPAVTTTFGPGPYEVTFDDRRATVTVDVGRPWSDLVYGFTAFHGPPIICPAGLKDPESLATKPAGSGPYVLESSRRGDEYRFKAREGYDWGVDGNATSAPGFPKTLIFKVVSSDSTAANLMLTGGLDVGVIQGADAARLMRNGDIAHKKATEFGMHLMVFNQAPGRVTADIAVRRALSMAIDRKAWNKTANDGTGALGTSMIGAHGDCYDRSTAALVPRYDPAVAKELLERAGWIQGGDGKLRKDGKPLRVKVLGWTQEGTGPDYVGEALNQVGIDANVVKTEIATYAQIATKGDFDIQLLPLTNYVPTANVNIRYLIGPGGKEGMNWGRIQNPAAEQALHDARASVGAERCAAWGTLHRAFLEHADFLPLAQPAFPVFSTGPTFDALGQIVIPASIRVK